ncbi:MAG: EamA family transporter [Magnetococcales bacterium]|nr:EamA family transporter [Magnetococcales bacterium]
MSASFWGILLVVLCSVLEGFAQVCLKKSAMAVVGRWPWLTVGLLFFGLEAVFYSGALQRLEVSTAYALGALSFVSVNLFSRWLLREVVDTRRWFGLGLILLGCILVGVQG